MSRLLVLPLLPLVLAAFLGAGCGGGQALTVLPQSAEVAPSPRRLAESLRRMTGAAPDAFVVLRMQRAGLTPAFGSRFRLASGPIAGFIPGRHPTRSDELVVVGAEIGTPGGAALLEAARLVAVRATYAARPERTVLVALWPRGATVPGLAATLRAPLWSSDAVAGAWVVTGDEARVADVLTAFGVSGGVLRPHAAGLGAAAEAEQLTTAVLALVDREAGPTPPPAVVAPDTLATSR